MKAVDVQWYKFVAKKRNVILKLDDDSNLKDRSKLIHRLLYTTILQRTCINVNFNMATSEDALLGIEGYNAKISPNNIFGLMILTNPPVLFTMVSNAQRGINQSLT